MKATLIIKNIESLYTCDKDFTVYKHAFIACYHDKIIDLGVHDYKKWIDSATRVLDACGETVIPAFIDCNFEGFSKVRLGDQLRENNSALYAMKTNGILTILSDKKRIQKKELTQDVFVRKQESKYPIIEREQDFHELKPQKFIVSCGFGKPNSYVYSFQHLAYILFLQVPTMEHYYQTLGRPLIHRMIKNGIPFYPNWIVC